MADATIATFTTSAQAEAEAKPATGRLKAVWAGFVQLLLVLAVCAAFALPAAVAFMAIQEHGTPAVLAIVGAAVLALAWIVGGKVLRTLNRIADELAERNAIARGLAEAAAD